MKKEHTEGAGVRAPFTSAPYGILTTVEIEWYFVVTAPEGTYEAMQERTLRSREKTLFMAQRWPAEAGGVADDTSAKPLSPEQKRQPIRLNVLVKRAELEVARRHTQRPRYRMPSELHALRAVIATVA